MNIQMNLESSGYTYTLAIHEGRHGNEAMSKVNHLALEETSARLLAVGVSRAELMRALKETATEDDYYYYVFSGLPLTDSQIKQLVLPSAAEAVHA